MGKNAIKSKKFCQGYRIPTILNGKIVGKNMEMTCNEEIYMNRKNKTMKLNQHKVILKGDSFFRGIRDNVELSISNRFGIHSFLQPGGDLDTILQSAYKAQKD
jgi:hypothetical protein